MILDFESSPSHITVREGARVTLSCRGDGVPLPRVTWRREDGRPINIAPDRKKEGLTFFHFQLGLNEKTNRLLEFFCIISDFKDHQPVIIELESRLLSEKFINNNRTKF